MKTVVLTGASRGIGHATAKQFSEKGWRVITCSRAPIPQVCPFSKGQIEHLEIDFSHEEELEAGIEKLVTLLDDQPVHALVNNAGIAHKQVFADLNDEQWNLTMNVDLRGMMYVVRAAQPMLVNSDQASVVCLSSIAGAAVGWGDHVPYVTAKSGVMGLVKGLAIDMASDGIRVNGIAPGLIRTAQSLSEEHSVGPEGLAAMEPSVPLGRIGKPEDIAGVAMFLASEQAGYLTGQTIIVDGGLTVAL